MMARKLYVLSLVLPRSGLRFRGQLAATAEDNLLDCHAGPTHNASNANGVYHTP